MTATAKLTIPCLCCGQPLRVKPDKKGNPFLKCAPCGVQVFVRQEDGVEKFDARFGTAWRTAPIATAAETKTEPARAASSPPPETKPAPKPTTAKPAATPKTSAPEKKPIPSAPPAPQPMSGQTDGGSFWKW